MKIYLDIDDTLITNYIEGNSFKVKPANHLKKFLKHVIENYDVYWLTTHCNGDASTAVAYISRFIDNETIDLVKKIKPTKWNVLKTEAINMDEDFLWFDDSLFPEEEQQLKDKNKLGSFVRMDLENDPNILSDFLDQPPICKGYVIDFFKKSYMLHIWTYPKFSVGWHRKIDGSGEKIFRIKKY